MKNTVRNSVGILAGFFMSALALGEVPNQKEVYINGISYGGPGCKQGTVGSYISDDAKVFTLAFDDYQVKQDRNSAPTDARKFCNLNVDLHIPHGWQFTIAKIDYRGYANLDSGLVGSMTSQYRFSGGASTRPLKVIFAGPVAQDYLKTDLIGISSLIWSPCGVSRALNIKSSLQLEGDRRKTGLLTLDTIDGEFSVVYALQWRRC
jgi:hypothetical protein